MLVWLIFGHAAARGSIEMFVSGSGVGVGIPLLASLYFMIRRNFVAGIACNFFSIPIFLATFIAVALLMA
jgi:hypothetical protein